MSEDQELMCSRNHYRLYFHTCSEISSPLESENNLINISVFSEHALSCASTRKKSFPKRRSSLLKDIEASKVVNELKHNLEVLKHGPVILSNIQENKTINETIKVVRKRKKSCSCSNSCCLF